MKKLTFVLMLAGCEVRCPVPPPCECSALEDVVRSKELQRATCVSESARTERYYSGCTENEILLNRKIDELKAELAKLKGAKRK